MSRLAINMVHGRVGKKRAANPFEDLGRRLLLDLAWELRDIRSDLRKLRKQVPKTRAEERELALHLSQRLGEELAINNAYQAAKEMWNNHIFRPAEKVKELTEQGLIESVRLFVACYDKGLHTQEEKHDLMRKHDINAYTWDYILLGGE